MAQPAGHCPHAGMEVHDHDLGRPGIGAVLPVHAGCGGEIVYFDEEIYPFLKYHIPVKNFNRIHIDSTKKYVKGNLNGLVSEIKKIVPEIKFPVEFD